MPPSGRRANRDLRSCASRCPPRRRLRRRSSGAAGRARAPASPRRPSGRPRARQAPRRARGRTPPSGESPSPFGSTMAKTPSALRSRRCTRPGASTRSAWKLLSGSSYSFLGRSAISSGRSASATSSRHGRGSRRPRGGARGPRPPCSAPTSRRSMRSPCPVPVPVGRERGHAHRGARRVEAERLRVAGDERRALHGESALSRKARPTSGSIGRSTGACSCHCDPSAPGRASSRPPELDVDDLVGARPDEAVVDELGGRQRERLERAARDAGGDAGAALLAADRHHVVRVAGARAADIDGHPLPPPAGRGVTVTARASGPVGVGVGEERVGLELAEARPRSWSSAAGGRAHRPLGRGAVEAEARRRAAPPTPPRDRWRGPPAPSSVRASRARPPSAPAPSAGGPRARPRARAASCAVITPAAQALDLGVERAARRGRGPADAHAVALRAHGHRRSRGAARRARWRSARSRSGAMRRSTTPSRSEARSWSTAISSAGQRAAVDLDLPGPLPGVVGAPRKSRAARPLDGDAELGDLVARGRRGAGSSCAPMVSPVVTAPRSTGEPHAAPRRRARRARGWRRGGGAARAIVTPGGSLPGRAARRGGGGRRRCRGASRRAACRRPRSGRSPASHSSLTRRPAVKAGFCGMSRMGGRAVSQATALSTKSAVPRRSSLCQLAPSSAPADPTTIMRPPCVASVRGLGQARRRRRR